MLRESRPLLSCGVVAAKQQRPFEFGGRRQIGARIRGFRASDSRIVLNGIEVTE
jgi:hypothetical protein